MTVCSGSWRCFYQNREALRRKRRFLESEFHLAMTQEVESEVPEMCNLGHGILERGILGKRTNET